MQISSSFLKFSKRTFYSITTPKLSPKSNASEPVHKLSHLAPRQAQDAEEIKNNFMILGKYKKYFDNGRNQMKAEKLANRAKTLITQLPPPSVKRLSSPKPFGFETVKADRLRGHVQDTINETLSSGFTPHPFLHPLFWEVTAVDTNPSLSSVYINWRARENTVYSKEEIELKVPEGFPKFKLQLQKKLRKFKNTRIKFSPTPHTFDDTEELLERIQSEVQLSDKYSQ